jgi:RimJ/RimL family protein N-acetyltransferase
MLVGKCVTLSPVEREHLGLLKRWRNDPEIRGRSFPSQPATDLGQEVWYERMINGNRDVFFIVRYTENLRAGVAAPLVGYGAISEVDWRRRRAVASVILGEKKYWGKGLGTEVLALLFAYAFCEMGLHKVCLHAYSDNERSIRMCKHFAPVEGQLRSHEFRDGKWQDVTVMGLTEERYFAEVHGKPLPAVGGKRERRK